MARLKRLSLVACMALAAVLVAPAVAAPPVAADDVFAQAKAEARQQHKHILLVFSASWCGPCKMYEGFLDDPQMKPITDKAFVVARIDVGERPGDSRHADTPGGVKLRTTLGGIEEPGFPFLIMTDEDGTPIANSYRNNDPNKNIGYPALPEEIDWYINMLKHAAPSLSADDIAATRKWLQRHSPV